MLNPHNFMTRVVASRELCVQTARMGGQEDAAEHDNENSAANGHASRKKRYTEWLFNGNCGS